MKFKLTNGLHVHGKRVFSEGSVIDSPSDLTKIFKGKFEKVAAETPAQAVPLPGAAQKPAGKAK